MRSTRHAFIGLLLAGAAALFFTAHAARADTLADIEARKVVRIGVMSDYPPFGFTGSDFKLRGSDIDVAHLIGSKLGARVEFVPVTTPNRIPYLTTGKIDLIVAGLAKSPERARVIDFSIAYQPFVSAIYGPRSVAIKSYADLDGKTVGVTRGSLQDNALVQKVSPRVTIQRFEDDATTVAAMVSQQVQYVAMGAPLAGITLAKNPKLPIEFKLVLTSVPAFVGVRKGDAQLKAAVNRILRAARADGTLEKISKHWFGVPLGDLPD